MGQKMAALLGEVPVDLPSWLSDVSWGAYDEERPFAMLVDVDIEKNLMSSVVGDLLLPVRNTMFTLDVEWGMSDGASSFPCTFDAHTPYPASINCYRSVKWPIAAPAKVWEVFMHGTRRERLVREGISVYVQTVNAEHLIFSKLQVYPKDCGFYDLREPRIPLATLMTCSDDKFQEMSQPKDHPLFKEPPLESL